VSGLFSNITGNETQYQDMISRYPLSSGPTWKELNVNNFGCQQNYHIL